MSYTLGIDLGTTFTSAAVVREGRAVTIPLGNHGASIPSVISVQEDGSILIGDAAVRRGGMNPERMAREFKRRIGDTQPLFLGGAPHSPEQLTARLLSSVYEEVAGREGGAPEQVVVSHPANWGDYKIDLLNQAVEMSGIEAPVALTTEPEAAAVFYAEQDARLTPGDTIAVYDLGGGTFDAAVLTVTNGGFDVIGEPSGIERFGGIDLDAAVLRHVLGAIDADVDSLDPDDEAATLALQRLREECTTARELLSADTTVSIPVLLPGINTSVRLTRPELEAMARPGLEETVGALRRTLTSAGRSPEDIASVVLVGGTSRMPLVSQLLSAALERPIALTSDPTHAVALGAALSAEAIRTGGSAAPGESSDSADSAESAGTADAVATEPDDQPDSSSTKATTAVHEQSATEKVGAFVPAEKKATGGFNPLLVGAAVVGLLVLGGIAFALTRGGGDNPEVVAQDTEVVEADGAAEAEDPAEAPEPTEVPEADPATEPEDASEEPEAEPEPTEVVDEGPQPVPVTLGGPIVAAVDAGTAVQILAVDPTIGTNAFAPTSVPPEYLPARPLAGTLNAWIDTDVTLASQFYDFATFSSALTSEDPTGEWQRLVPASWSAVSPDIPSTFEELGVPADEPILGISFEAAEGYCKYALRRLPSEIEWEVGAAAQVFDSSGIANWVGGSEFYTGGRQDTPVLRGGGTASEDAIFRRSYEGAENAGIRCAMDEIIEVLPPSGELIYSREFSPADVARDWPDLNDPNQPDFHYGYHAPAVFHIEIGNPSIGYVLANESHDSNTEVSVELDLRKPAPGEGQIRYGILANASTAGGLTFQVSPNPTDGGVDWCLAIVPGGSIDDGGDRGAQIQSEGPECVAEGFEVTEDFRNTISMRFVGDEIELFVDGTSVDTVEHPLFERGGRFGTVVQAFEGDPILHVHFDNLIVRTS